MLDFFSCFFAFSGVGKDKAAATGAGTIAGIMTGTHRSPAGKGSLPSGPRAERPDFDPPAEAERGVLGWLAMSGAATHHVITTSSNIQQHSRIVLRLFPTFNPGALVGNPGATITPELLQRS